MSAARAYQLGLVSEVTPSDALMERALWIASRIASAPALAVEGTLRAIWAANELSRNTALAQVSALVKLGTQYENIEQGQESFKTDAREWRLR
jgi:enoyl-CoA hydratase/carnithine racemase